VRLRRGVIQFGLAAMLLSLSFKAEAQQPGNISRIGFLDVSTASGSAVLVDTFREGRASLDGLKERTLPSSIDSPSKSLSANLSLRPTWLGLRLI
jgi:hypothetical protein